MDYVIDQWSAELRADLDDSFFFDHPLDHLPGMLLLSGLLDLAGKAGSDHSRPSTADQVRSRLRFTKMCELDHPVTLRGIREPAGDDRCWTVAATQGDSQTCEGVIGFRAGVLGGEGIAGQQAVPGPAAPSHLVHCQRPENVLVGAMSRVTDGVIEAPVLSPQVDHFLAGIDPGFRSALEIVEAGRQFGIMIEHGVRGRPADSRFLWLSLVMDIPWRMPRSIPLTLRWRVSDKGGYRFRYVMSLAAADSHTAYGTLEYEFKAMQSKSYTNLRAAGRL